jgi:hypothetical protein
MEKGWDGEAEIQHANTGQLRAFVGILRVPMKNIVIQVGEDLPTVGRMCFLDTGEVEVDAVCIGLVNFFHAPGIFTEKWSLIGPEDQRDRFASTLRELEHFTRSFAVRV